MNKKVLLGAVVVFVLVFVLDYVVNNFFMMSDYQSVLQLWRPMEEMKMGVMVVLQLFFAYFFTLIFSKGYEGKGIAEGVRYGFYVAMITSLQGAYMSYATMPIPYSMALKWFLFGTVQTIIYGVALTFVFAKKQAPAS